MVSKKEIIYHHFLSPLHKKTPFGRPKELRRG
jgi:hypothetical protein